MGAERKMKPPITTKTFQLEARQWDKFRSLAGRYGVSASELLRQLMAAAIAEAPDMARGEDQ